MINTSSIHDRKSFPRAVLVQPPKRPLLDSQPQPSSKPAAEAELKHRHETSLCVCTHIYTKHILVSKHVHTSIYMCIYKLPLTSLRHSFRFSATQPHICAVPHPGYTHTVPGLHKHTLANINPHTHNPIQKLRWVPTAILKEGHYYNTECGKFQAPKAATRLSP